MDKITRFTGNKVDEFRSEFAEFVKSFERRHDVAIDLGSITYRSDQLTAKMTVTVVKEGDNPEDAMYKQSLKEHGWKFNVTEEDYNKNITFMGKIYNLRGIKSRKQRFPIVVKKQSDGQMYKLPASCLK